MRCGMTSAALDRDMFTFQSVAGLLVIEDLRIPLNKWEVLAVMIGVAAYALLAGPGGDVIRPVQTALGGDARTNVGMTPDASKFRLAPTDLVAVGAVHGAVEKLMLPGQRPRRNLGVRLRGEEANEQCAAEIQKQPR